MKNFKKYLAFRLIALLMLPYSASAAAACPTQLDYGIDNAPDFAYEAAAYRSDQLHAACPVLNKANMAYGTHAPYTGNSGASDIALYSI